MYAGESSPAVSHRRDSEAGFEHYKDRVLRHQRAFDP